MRDSGNRVTSDKGLVTLGSYWSSCTIRMIGLNGGLEDMDDGFVIVANLDDGFFFAFLFFLFFFLLSK